MPEHTQSVIELRGIKKYYSGRMVLGIDSFSFEQGKRYALLGANGTGKSTLLRILAGLLTADEGDIVRDGHFEKKDIAYMPQKPYAFALPVEKSVLIGAEHPQAQDFRLALRALERVGMQDFQKEREDKLSGGEAQRVALARVLLQPRKLLLLDEPTSATDIMGVEMIEEALKEFCDAARSTLVVATHSPAQAMRLADVVLFMDAGKIVEYGDAKSVLLSPANERAQAFLRNWKF